MLKFLSAFILCFSFSVQAAENREQREGYIAGIYWSREDVNGHCVAHVKSTFQYLALGTLNNAREKIWGIIHGCKTNARIGDRVLVRRSAYEKFTARDKELITSYKESGSDPEVFYIKALAPNAIVRERPLKAKIDSVEENIQLPEDNGNYCVVRVSESAAQSKYGFVVDQSQCEKMGYKAKEGQSIPVRFSNMSYFTRGKQIAALKRRNASYFYMHLPSEFGSIEGAN